MYHTRHDRDTNQFAVGYDFEYLELFKMGQVAVHGARMTDPA